MNVRALLAVVVAVVLGALAWPTPSHAESEKAKTNQGTKVYRRAGEQSPVILELKTGQTVTIIARDGRWLRVRVSGRTGWIPRSKVDLPEGDDDIQRNTRRQPFVGGRGTKRGFGGETGPQDRIGADATDDSSEPAEKPDKTVAKPEKTDKTVARPEKPDKTVVKPDKVVVKPEKPAKNDKPAAKPEPAATPDDDEDVINLDDDSAGKTSGAEPEAAKEPARPMAHVAKATKVVDRPDGEAELVFTADKKTPLYVGRTKGEWTRVSSEDGDAGWVLTSQLDVEQPAEVAAGPRTTRIQARARLGVTVVNQSLATQGGMANTPPDNYSAGSPTVTLALGGELLRPVGKRLWIGGELDYDIGLLGGITYQSKSTGFIYHNLNLRAAVGYDLQTARGMIVFARIGYHFDSFQVADVADFTKNAAKIPNQIIQAPTLGAALAIPRLTQKLGFTLSVDTILVGSSVSQTKNLEDGTSPSATGAFVGAHLVYRWKPRMDLQLAYDLSYLSLSFAGMAPATSVRGHTGTAASSGSDFNNALTAGVGYAF